MLYSRTLLFIHSTYNILYLLIQNLKKKESLYWTCYSTASVSCFGLVFLAPSLWDLSCPTRDQTCILWIGKWNLNHWTTREVPLQTCLNMKWFVQIMCSNIWHIVDVHLMLILFSPPVFLRENSSLPLLTLKKMRHPSFWKHWERSFHPFFHLLTSPREGKRCIWLARPEEMIYNRVPWVHMELLCKWDKGPTLDGHSPLNKGLTKQMASLFNTDSS